MKAHGLAQIESARRDGRWDDAYENQRSISVPADLRERLDQDKRASEFFASLDSKNRYAISVSHSRRQEAGDPCTSD